MRQLAILAALAALALPSLAQAGDIAGTVYDAQGRPAAGVALVLGERQALTGADGAYRFDGVAPGQHVIAAGTQRVAVAVEQDGSARRNIFLLSRAARATVTGEPAAAANAPAVLADAMLRAQQLLAEGEGRQRRVLGDIDG